MTALDLPDLNLWLALTDADHQHHGIARKYWEDQAATRLGFCRVTMLGLLRLLTNRTVMAGRPFTASEAWSAYRTYVELPEVVFLDETTGTAHQFAVWTDTASFPRTSWTDAWLAALALTAEARLVSFDNDFRAFDGLDFLHLK